MKVVALSGLTECGKGAAADYLQSHGFLKVKIGSILQNVYDEDRSQDDFQDWNFKCESERPDWLLGQFLRHLERHVNQNGYSACTIDSLYGPVMAKYLAERLGSNFFIIYVDTAFDERVRRQMRVGNMPDYDSAKATIHEKDAFKIAKGNMKVRDIANAIIDNNGPLSAYHEAIDNALGLHR